MSAEIAYYFRTRHCPDLGVSDWLKQISMQHNHAIRNITQIWVVTHHQYGISALVSPMSFGGETNGKRHQMLAIFPGYYLVLKKNKCLMMTVS